MFCILALAILLPMTTFQIASKSGFLSWHLWFFLYVTRAGHKQGRRKFARFRRELVFEHPGSDTLLVKFSSNLRFVFYFGRYGNVNVFGCFIVLPIFGTVLFDGNCMVFGSCEAALFDAQRTILCVSEGGSGRIVEEMDGWLEQSSKVICEEVQTLPWLEGITWANCVLFFLFALGQRSTSW